MRNSAIDGPLIATTAILLALGARPAILARTTLSPNTVIAVGATRAVVWDPVAAVASLRSLKNGECENGQVRAVAISEADYDPRLRQFWGSGVGDDGLQKLWSWAETGGSLIVAGVQAATIYSVHTGPVRRLVVLGAKASETSPARIAAWSADRLLHDEIDAPPPWPAGNPVDYWGSEAPLRRHGAYVVDPCRGRPLTHWKLSAAGRERVEAFLTCNTWLVGSRVLGSLWLSRDNGVSWSRRASIPGNGKDSLASLSGSPVDAKSAFAIVGRGDPVASFETWATNDLAKTWVRVKPIDEEPVESWPTSEWSVNVAPFAVPEGWWVQTTRNRANQDGSMASFLTLYARSGLSRRVELKNCQARSVGD